MQEKNIKTLSFGCRLNTLETEKIQKMLSTRIKTAIVVNTCAVTAEAERQSAQAVRKLSRENPNAPIFTTGCASTRNPALFAEIENSIVIDNAEKMNLDAYIRGLETSPCFKTDPLIEKFKESNSGLSKKYIQIQNGCNHICAYCVTRLLRGKRVSFEYNDILKEVKNAIKNGFCEIVLTGVDIASYASTINDKPVFISDICKMLLTDCPEIQRLRLSSLDPASPEIHKIIEMIKSEPKMANHLHLSMQSGSDTILKSMRRRHTADMVRKIMNRNDGFDISFSWDIICGFPGETDELFNETVKLTRELKPIKIHSFPFSPRPNTEAATMPNQIDKSVSKQRVKIIIDIADENKADLMQKQIGQTAQILVEENNWGKTSDEIAVKLPDDNKLQTKTLQKVTLKSISQLHFIGDIC